MHEFVTGGREIFTEVALAPAVVLRLLSIYALEAGELYAPAAFVLGALGIGLVFELLVLRKLGNAIALSRFAGKEVVPRSVRGVTTLWFGIAGVRFAITRLSFNPGLDSLLKDVLLVALILSGAIVLARLAGGMVQIHARRVQGLPSSSLLVNLARIAIFVVAGLIILQSFGVAIAPLIGALGVGGLALALALQETLSNLVSGILIMASRQLRPGDYVSLDSGEEGYVRDVTWRNTTIRALDNNMIIVPNSKLGQSSVTNFYQPERRMSVPVPLRVSYDSDLAHVEEVTLEVANEVMEELEGGVPEFEPSVRFNDFGESSIDLSVNLQTREVVEQYRIKHEFIKCLHRRYREEGIEIPYPVMTTLYANSSEG